MNATTERVAAAIRALYEREGLPPTIREIQQETGLSSTSVVTHHVAILERRGAITRRPGISRSIRPVGMAA
jgi:repressor LexA